MHREKIDEDNTLAARMSVFFFTVGEGTPPGPLDLKCDLRLSQLVCLTDLSVSQAAI